MHTFEQRNALIHYRRTFADMPVGDPMSGTPYGEYLKSKAVGMIIGIVAAVAAVFTGGATLAAYAGFTAAAGTVSLGSALAAGAMVAGGVMSGVGIITGNTKLTKIGGVLSLAGGLGSLLAAPAAGASGLGQTATEAAIDSGSLGGSSAATAEVVAGSAGEGGATLSANISKTTGATPEALAVDAVPTTDAAMGSMGSDTAATSSYAPSTPVEVGTISGTEPVQQAPASVAATAPSTTTSPTVYGGDTVADKGASYVNQSAPTTSGGGILAQSWEAAKDTGSGISKFANDNKGLMEIGGKMLSSYETDSVKERSGAETALANAQAMTQGTVQAANNAQTDALKQKTALDAQKAKNANTQIVMLDPRDPQYAAKKADAIARNIPWMDMAAPAQSSAVTAGGINWTASSQAPNVAIQK